MLTRIGVNWQEVRTACDLTSITHLIVPGGESTAVRTIGMDTGLWRKLADFQGPVMGTCMGSILMAREALSPPSQGFGMLDITVERNAYGRQIHSFSSQGSLDFSDEPFEMIFIRAPKVVRIADSVKPIAWLNGEVTGVLCGNKMALTFHPELSDDTCVHEYFLRF